MKGQPLTDRTIDTAKSRDRDYWITDSTGRRNEGSLAVRVSHSGSKRFYFRYVNPEKKRINLPIGNYGPGGLTLAQARDEARKLQGLHRTEDSRDVRAFQRAQADEKRRAKEAEQREKLAKEENERREREALDRFTLRKLLESYSARLDQAGKQSAKDARGIFERHVFKAFPDVAARPAASITARDVVAMLRKLTESGKGRTAGKLRSYLHAAFALALRAEFDPNAPADLVQFNLAANPVAPTGSLGEFSKARDRVLSESELRSYWEALEGCSPMTRDALQLALLLGGQRLAQLLRVTLADVDLDAKSITLRDGKGARKQPRVHVLPLCRDSLALVEHLSQQARDLNTPLLFTNDGKHPVNLETLSVAVAEISRAMVGAKAATGPFQMRDIRRTCETMLAALRVSSDIRAQIQSHGLGGIQAKHYDRHDYRDEKTDALSKWERKLRSIMTGEKDTKVVPLRNRGA